MSGGGRRTIPSLVRAAAEAVPDKIWLLTEDGEHTYGESLERILRAAGGLKAMGIGTGDRVLVTARNTAEYVFAWLALMELGAIQVPVNPKSSGSELAGFLDQASPKLIVSDRRLQDVVDDAVAASASGVGQADVHLLFESAPDGRDRGPADIDPEDMAVMIPTSGTTGRSKLVMQTHLAYVMAAEGFPWWLGLTADDRLMTALPLFHLNAPCYSVLGSLSVRASLALLPGFSARTFLDSARRFGATQFNAIGAMVEILMRQPRRSDDAENPVRICYTGPAPDRERHLEIEARFGFRIICGYALSETPYGLVWPRGERPYGTLGVPRQHPELGHVNDARVVDGDGRVLGPGEVGELELRNPAIMRGYFEMPEETAEVLVDGWLRTGDLVRSNQDGTYTFVGRKKQVIRRRGENLSPAEVEAVLERHPDVAEAAVIGVPSELSEEDVKAFVAPMPGRAINVDELWGFAKRHLARFKVPRYFEVLDELPHTATGRLLKRELPVERTPREVDMEVDMENLEGKGWPRSSIGSATPDTITVAGRDLPGELMGKVTLTQLAYLLLTGREPTPAQTTLLDAVLVSLAEHGITPSALAARLTYTGAPEAVQGAVAAGLLGAGSVLLGPAGDTAEFLVRALARHGLGPLDDATLRPVAAAAVEGHRREGRRIPGLGHPLHKVEDPRVPRIYQLAGELDLLGRHLRLLRLVAEAYEEATGRRLPINGAGAAGAALVDVGVPPASVRGFVLIARTAGLVAHLAEEAHRPMGMKLWAEVERRAGEADPA